MIVEEVINQFVLEEVTDETIVLYEGSLITQTLDSLVAADIATVVHAATSKTIPIDADELAIVDTAASNVLKKLTHINLYNYLKTKFDLVYTTLSSTVTSVFGRTGAVVAAINDYTWAQINKTTSSIADITTRNLSDLTQTSSYRTVTDTEKGTWNGKQDDIGFTPENVANKASAFQVTPDNTKYPTEKLVKDSLDGKSDTGHNHSGVYQPVGSYEVTTNKGAANGYASLGADGLVPAAQLPSYVDDVIEVANYAVLPVTGETSKIYVTLDNNLT